MATANFRVSAGDRRQQILNAATELFARQGFRGTTTRQIAQRAGINEAIIFRHFATKDDLYWAILQEKSQLGDGLERLEQQLESGGSDVDVLAGVAERLFRRDAAMTRLLLFSALENHGLSHRFFRTHVAEYYEALASYIRQRVAEGRFRQVDPLLAARSFLGMVFYHYIIQELFGGKGCKHFDPAAISKTLANIFLQGMLPSGNDSASLARSRPSNAHYRMRSENVSR